MNTQTHYFIVGNYLDDTYNRYIPKDNKTQNWDRTFDPANNLGGMSIINQIECYCYDVINYKIPFTPNAAVRVAKQVAGKLGRKKADASVIIVDEATKDKIVEHFAPEFDKGFGVLRVDQLA